jgi:hypothetical protein
MTPAPSIVPTTAPLIRIGGNGKRQERETGCHAGVCGDSPILRLVHRFSSY